MGTSGLHDRSPVAPPAKGRHPSSPQHAGRHVTDTVQHRVRSGRRSKRRRLAIEAFPIGEPCCGFHGIGLITVLLAGYFWWFVAAVLWKMLADLPWPAYRVSAAAVVIGAGTFALWMALAPAVGRDPSSLGQSWSTRGRVFRIAGSTLTVPIGTFTWFSCLLSSVAFGMLHGDAWIAGTVAGMLFASAVYTRGRLGDAVVAHATTNTLLSCSVIATGSWSQ